MTHEIVVADTKATDIAAIEEELSGGTIETTEARAPDEVIDATGDADALIVDASTQVTAEVLGELDLAVVGRSGIGFDNIDVAAAEEEGTAVVNVPDYCIDEVSTHALSLALACLRRLETYHHGVAGGAWDWTLGRPIGRLAGSTVGLVAFGAIGRRLASKLRGFDVSVLAYDPYVPGYRMTDFGVEKVGFEELLSRSSIVSIHAPLTDETRGMFDAEAFDAMREDAILVNTARGPIVEERALVEALRSGAIDSAGLDVREEEPPGDSPLHGREDVLLTPHVAWYSEDSRTELGHTVAADVDRVLRGEEPQNPVDPDEGWF